MVIAIALITIGNTAAIVFCYKQSKRTVVIDVIKVFNEFKLKKDLESRVAVKLNDFSAGIDSLKAVYSALEKNKAGSETLHAVAANIDTLQSRAQRAYVISDKNINEQVWVRLNTLLNEYGAKNDYQLVIGANGMGTVLYNEKDIDKTEELIKFVNERYELGH